MICSTDRELSFIGAPIMLDEVCLIKPSTVLDRIKLGNLYGKYLGLLTISEEDIEEILDAKLGQEAEVLTKVTPLDYLLMSAEYSNTFLLELKKAFSTFIREEVFIIPKISKVFIGKPEQERIIDNSNFERFQEILRLQNHLEIPEEIPEDENPMQRKFRLRRKQLKEAKMKQIQKDKNAPEFIDLMSSLCCMNVGITWNNIKEVPIYTFYELLGRNQMREKFDLDTRSLLAGADSKKIKVNYWINKNQDN